MSQISGKTVLISGTSEGGIGSALAFEFQKRGYTVFATARNTKRIDPKLIQLPNVEVLELDVVSNDSIRAAVKAIEDKTGGKLDILVNNSGGGYNAPVIDASIEEAKTLFDLNLWALISVTQSFIPLLIKSKGTVVNIGSVAGELHMPFQGMYNASKAAVNMTSETLRLELKPLGVNVVTAMVGGVSTKFQKNARTDNLKEDSLYRPVEAEFMTAASGEALEKANPMSASTFASKLVGDIVGGSTGRVWRGGSSSTTKWAKSLLPDWVVDYLLNDFSGIKKLG